MEVATEMTESDVSLDVNLCHYERIQQNSPTTDLCREHPLSSPLVGQLRASNAGGMLLTLQGHQVLLYQPSHLGPFTSGTGKSLSNRSEEHTSELQSR